MAKHKQGGCCTGIQELMEIVFGSSEEALQENMQRAFETTLHFIHLKQIKGIFGGDLCLYTYFLSSPVFFIFKSDLKSNLKKKEMFGMIIYRRHFSVQTVLAPKQNHREGFQAGPAGGQRRNNKLNAPEALAVLLSSARPPQPPNPNAACFARYTYRRAKRMRQRIDSLTEQKC